MVAISASPCMQTSGSREATRQLASAPFCAGECDVSFKAFQSHPKASQGTARTSLVFMTLAASGLIACSEPGASPDTSGAIEANQRPGAEPNDPEYGKQWHLPKIGAPAAWETASGNPSVIAAVLDNGFDLTHPDLVDAIWTNPKDAPDGVDNDENGLVDDVHGWNFADNNADLKDTDGHGTHVAGLIGAVKNNGISVAGVASGVTILPIPSGTSRSQSLWHRLSGTRSRTVRRSSI